MKKPSNERKYTEEEVARIVATILEKGAIVGNSPEATKAKKPTTSTVKLAEAKVGKSTIEVAKFTDKDGAQYISQVKVLESGTKTKGFAVPLEDFKAYVGKLNSILDKMGK